MSSLAQAQALLDHREAIVREAILDKLINRGRILPGETLFKVEFEDGWRRFTISKMFFPEYPTRITI